MTVTTKFPTANEIETTGFTDPNNAHADDGSYATAAPGKNAEIGTRWKTWDFDTAIAASPTPTITKVQIIYEYKVNTNKSAATMRTRARISDVDEENHDDTAEPLADTVITVDITADRSWTRADLLDAVLKVTMAAIRGNSNNAVTFSLDQVKVEVTWNANVTVTPGLLALTLATFAPTVSTPRLVTPGVLALVLTAFAPTVTIGGSVTVTPGTLALVLATFAPVITVSDNKTVIPGLLALTLAAFTPTVTATANQLVTPGVLALALTTFAPTVTATGGGITVTPGVASLILATFIASVVVRDQSSWGVTITEASATAHGSMSRRRNT